MNLSRRDFLSSAALLTLAGVPRVLLRAASAPGAGSDQVLVVLQLSGGNDGLNTVVPFESDEYHRARPTLRIDSPLVLGGAGDTPLGFHPEMGPLHELYGEGRVVVVNGVGYPNPNRSHFRSMDIWHTAEPEREDVADGWLGRALPTGPRPIDALHIGSETRPLALAGDRAVPSLQNLDFLDFLTTPRGQRMQRQMRRLNERPREGGVESIRALAATTVSQLERLTEIRGRRSPVEYDDTDVSRRLELAAQLIAGGAPNRVYYISQSGYDTHASQADAHAQLVRELSSAIRSFQRHLEAVGAAKRVTLVAFSEFGRRVRENGSLGTDHGVAGPMLVVSARATGGVVGAYPSLADLTEGDLRHSIDFRRVYATLLEEVLAVDSAAVLGGRFERLSFLAPA